ncbi:MAG: hypothetical protein ACR5LD_08610 [Symbiopectobacterium sp.]
MLLRWLNVYRLAPEHVEKPMYCSPCCCTAVSAGDAASIKPSYLVAHKPLASWLRCRYHPHALRRLRHTPLKQHLCASERLYNLRHGFSWFYTCDQDLSGLRVALVDDMVVTTGNTVIEICRVL